MIVLMNIVNCVIKLVINVILMDVLLVMETEYYLRKWHVIIHQILFVIKILHGVQVLIIIILDCIVAVLNIYFSDELDSLIILFDFPLDNKLF